MVATATLGTSCLCQWALILICNFSPRQGYSRATVTRIEETVRVRIRVSRPLSVRAGQYLNIWMPTLDLRSTVQSHPFMIAAWTERRESKTMDLELLVKPKSGFTKTLMAVAKNQLDRDGSEKSGEEPLSDTWMVWYSGPHGSPESIGNYGSVLMIATGFGIASQTSILQELVRGHAKCQVKTRRLHLVWQLESWGSSTSSNIYFRSHYARRRPHRWRRPAGRSPLHGLPG